MSLSRKKISPTSAMHFFKLCFRSTLFFAALILYIINRVRRTGEHFGGYEDKPLFLLFLWAVFVVEMILRFFPQKSRAWVVKNSLPGIIVLHKPDGVAQLPLPLR